AMALSNQSGRLAELERYEEALTAATRAAQMYEQLAAERPDAFLPALATVLNNQSTCLGELERYEEALAAITRAIAILEGLATRWPAAFTTDLERSLQLKAIIEGML
ncbi:ATP-binding protein, partial [Streptomyces sp. NPDC059496]